MPSLIADFCATYITDHGPASADEIYEAAYAVNVTTAGSSAGVKQVLRRYSGRFVQLPDERYDTAKRRLTGAILTHHVSYQHADNDWLWPGPALSPFQSLMEESGSLPLQSGGSITPRQYSPKVWSGPPGWMPQLGDDQLLGFRWTGTALEVKPVTLSGGGTDTDDGASRSDMVRDVLKRHYREPMYTYYSSNGTYGLTPTVLSALVEVPDLLSVPVPPLDDLMDVPRRRLSAAHGGLGLSTGTSDEQLIVRLPSRAKDELHRRAAAIGVPAAEYSGELLSAAVWRHEPHHAERYDRFDPYPAADPFDQSYGDPFAEPPPYDYDPYLRGK